MLKLLVLHCRSEDGEWDPEAAALMSAGSSEEGLAFSEKVDPAVDGDVAAEQARVQAGGAAGDTICLRNLRKVYGAQGKASSKVGAQTPRLGQGLGCMAYSAVLLGWGLAPCAGLLRRVLGYSRCLTDSAALTHPCCQARACVVCAHCVDIGVLCKEAVAVQATRCKGDMNFSYTLTW